MRVPILILICVVTLVACSGKPPVRSIADVDDGKVFGQREVTDFEKTTMPPGGISADYYIGVGDLLDVVFFFNEELTKEALLVRTDGRITLPYVGDIVAAGRTPMELDSLLTDEFGEILREPNLSVIVRETPDQQVYVLGEVEQPGAFEFDRNISLMGSLARAGGLENGAKTTHVLVIRREGLEKIVGVEVDVKAIMKGGAINHDIMLRNLDIVYVPKTRLKSVADFTEILYDIIETPLDLALRGYTVYLLDTQIELIQAVGD